MPSPDFFTGPAKETLDTLDAVIGLSHALDELAMKLNPDSARCMLNQSEEIRDHARGAIFHFTRELP